MRKDVEKMRRNMDSLKRPIEKNVKEIRTGFKK